MIEIWLPVEGFEGVYAVSNYGRCYSYKRKSTKGGYLKPKKDAKGYYHYDLSINGKITQKRVNILIYETFIGKVPKGMHINHKDEDKSNNAIWNLNLLTPKENDEWGTRLERIVETRTKNKRSNGRKEVLQYSIDGVLLNEFKSVADAAKSINKKPSQIWDAIKGKQKTCGGSIWRYKNGDQS